MTFTHNATHPIEPDHVCAMLAGGAAFRQMAKDKDVAKWMRKGLASPIRAKQLQAVKEIVELIFFTAAINGHIDITRTSLVEFGEKAKEIYRDNYEDNEDER